MIRTVVLALLASVPALAQDRPPVIAPYGVVHGASYQPLGAQFGGFVAPGSIFILKGAYLGPDELVAGSAPFGLRLPDAPGGTEVHVRSLETGELMQAAIVHAWAFQVAALLPERFPLGDAEAQVWYEGRASEPAAFPVVRSYPALFSSNQVGSGRGIIQNYEASGELPLNGLTRSARPGQHVILWGTGLGDARRQDVQASIAGRSLSLEYAGPAPGLPGVDQLNLRLPDDLDAIGCYVALRLKMGEVLPGQVSIAIAPDGGPCEHPWGLSAERLAEIEAGARATYLRLAIRDATLAPDLALSPFGSMVYGEARALNESALEGYSGRSLFGRNRIIPASRFDCGSWISARIGDFRPGGSEPIPAPPEPADPPDRGADIGFPWVLTGPNGERLELPQQGDEWFTRVGFAGPVTPEPGFLKPGIWRLQAPGGSEIGPVDATAILPAVPEIDSPAAIRRGEDFELTWAVDADAPPVAATVQISFQYPDPERPGQSESIGLGCPADYRTGRLTVRFSELNRPIDGATEAELSFRVASLEPTAQVPGLDWIEVDASAFRTWKIPLE